MRKSGLGLLMAASRGSRRPLAFIEDTAVPPERLNDYVAEIKALLDARGLEAGFYGHCSVGCLHIRPFVDLRAAGGVDVMREVAEEVAEMVLRYGGVNASEHGDGLVRSPFNRRMFGDEIYEAMREVKRLFDPHGVLNPGKIVDAGPMTEHLRDPALPPAAPLATTLALRRRRGDAHGGRPLHEHRPLPQDGQRASCARRTWRRARRSTRRAAARTPSCARCRSPTRTPRSATSACTRSSTSASSARRASASARSSVDMAALKSEFLSHYQDVHGTPLRSRAFGAIRALNRVGRRARAGVERRCRGCPARGRCSSARWGSPPSARCRASSARRCCGGTRAATGATTAAPRGDVVLLADSFTTFTEPWIGRAAVELLERAGWRVRLQSARLLRAGEHLEGAARATRGGWRARWSTGSRPTRERGTPIVGVEPSCLLDAARRVPVAAAGRRARRGRRRRRRTSSPTCSSRPSTRATSSCGPTRRSPAGGSSCHGHCHEKAGVGTEATRALLERIPGAEVEELDAGCCGMAGSFGFEAEHYDLSRQVGELRLFPALRGEPADTVVAATGVSCRQQIGHFAGRTARHPVVLVAEAAGLAAPRA